VERSASKLAAKLSKVFSMNVGVGTSGEHAASMPGISRRLFPTIVEDVVASFFTAA
jgi:hypothetical protein